MSYSGLLQIFAEQSVGPLEDFISLVDHNAKKAIDSGTEPGEAYRWAIAGVMDWVREQANKTKAERDALSPPGEAVDGKLTLTLGRLLDANTTPLAKTRRRNMLDGVRRNVVYVVRDGEAVLYVGCTRGNARTRLREHIGGKSLLGQAIKRERPRSQEWTAEMISHPDHKSALETEKKLTEQYKPRYCAAYAQRGDLTTCQEPYKGQKFRPIRRRYLAP